MLRGIGVAIVMLIVAATYGCAQQSRAAVVVEDKTYALTPATVTVKAGVVTGAMTEMKVTERIETGSGRIVTPAKLTGSLKLKNTSANESVRLIGAKIFYLDGYGAERLDPGQEATQAVDVEFPAAALKAKSLKDIRLELTYIQSPYKAEAVTFAVTIT